MKRLSIIVITYNGLGFLTRCLASLQDFIADTSCEIIIIDNHSTDGTLEFLRENYPQLQLIVNNENRGVAAARNQGIKVAEGEKLLLLDNDTEATTTAINAMSQHLDSHPDVGLCSCRLVDKEGIPQDSCKPYPGLIIKLRNVLGIGNKTKYEPNEEGIIEPLYVIGACQMFSREVVDKVGLLDEHIFYGPEDADWCLRIKKEGWRIHCLNNHTIIHDYRRSTKKRPFSKLGRLHIKALIYFYWKHKRLF
ncbi:MAG: glycosyltransferase family 2 protein [Muribaculaceae bacterium]|nr:glycosyltransferase family 2 protein [Muribaculaceae bacterium]